MSLWSALLLLIVVVLSSGLAACPLAHGCVPGWLAWSVTGIALLLLVHELLGRPIVFLRWSFLSLWLRRKHLVREWQVGDGREEATLRYVLKHAPQGDIDAVIDAIDRFAYRHSFLINVGDEKGAILDEIVRRTAPRRALELGAYVGYSALRIARQLPEDGHLYSIEYNASNADITRRMVAHAGATHRITVVTGHLGDGGRTLQALQHAHGFAAANLDFVFIDHAKSRYVPDLELLLQQGWLHPGSVAVADNVEMPGAPEYEAYMQAHEGKLWRTLAHRTHAEYQTWVEDVVLESTLL